MKRRLNGTGTYFMTFNKCWVIAPLDARTIVSVTIAEKTGMKKPV